MGTELGGFAVFDPVLSLNGMNTRRAEPRNTPTVVNAAFNRDRFWKGRAETLFNGVNPLGVRDPGAPWRAPMSASRWAPAPTWR